MKCMIAIKIVVAFWLKSQIVLLLHGGMNEAYHAPLVDLNIV